MCVYVPSGKIWKTVQAKMLHRVMCLKTKKWAVSLSHKWTNGLNLSNLELVHTTMATAYFSLFWCRH